MRDWRQRFTARPQRSGKKLSLRLLYREAPRKPYKILWLAHSSLTGSDLIRSLCRQLRIEAKMRRSDNVAEIHAAFAQLGNRWPLLVLEEAQNPSAVALEEVRLLTCAHSDTRPPFSLLLVGEDSLLPAAANRHQSSSALTTRLRLDAVGVHANPFEDQALELLVQAAGGLPRAINHLAQRAIEAAAFSGNTSISAIPFGTGIPRPRAF